MRDKASKYAKLTSVRGTFSGPFGTPIGVDSRLPDGAILHSEVLPNGNRVVISVQTDVSRDEAAKLIKTFRKDAKPAGQVSVRKPNRAGLMMPFAVDNLDGKGVTFNEEWFR